jgi:hypothetical protein
MILNAPIKPVFEKPKKGVNSIQPWVLDLPIIPQCTLFKLIRGYDLPVGTKNASKSIIKYIRKEIFVDSGNVKFFETEQDLKKAVKIFLYSNIDGFSIHFVNHLIEGIKTIAYCHPEFSKREEWIWVYGHFCTAQKVNPETPSQFKKRLKSMQSFNQNKAKKQAKNEVKL